MAYGYRTLEHWNDWLINETKGLHLLQAEQALLTKLVAKHLGSHVLLLGVPQQVKLLSALALPHHTLLGPLVPAEENSFVIESDFHELPILTGSIDLVVVPHTLQYIERSRHLLNEACRVVKPEGLIAIFGFNPYSCWGLNKLWHKSKQIPWNGDFIPAHHIINWLKLADFQLEHHSTLLFRPPFLSERSVNKCSIWESVGNACFPFLGGVYVILARAKIIPLTPIRMHWKQSLAGIRINAPVTGHIASSRN